MMSNKEILELIEWHEAEASRLADRNIPNVNLDKHQRSADTLRHLLQAQTWRPIEEAPKDGTEILASYAGIVRIVIWDTARGGIWSIWPGRERASPSRWMPLPPSTDEERASATPSEQQGTNDHDTE